MYSVIREKIPKPYPEKECSEDNGGNSQTTTTKMARAYFLYSEVYLIPITNKFPKIIQNSLNNSYLHKTLKSVLRIAKYNLLREFEIAPK